MSDLDAEADLNHPVVGDFEIIRRPARNLAEEGKNRERDRAHRRVLFAANHRLVREVIVLAIKIGLPSPYAIKALQCQRCLNATTGRKRLFGEVSTLVSPFRVVIQPTATSESRSRISTIECCAWPLHLRAGCWATVLWLVARSRCGVGVAKSLGVVGATSTRTRVDNRRTGDTTLEVGLPDCLAERPRTEKPRIERPRTEKPRTEIEKETGEPKKGTRNA